MGTLILPPGSYDEPPLEELCFLKTYAVVLSLPQALEVAYAHPDEHCKTFNPTNAKCFLLGMGDTFRIPPGNFFRISNCSNHEIVLTMTIIKTVKTSESDGESDGKTNVDKVNDGSTEDEQARGTKQVNQAESESNRQAQCSIA
jgi:hypothetical protein